MSNGNSSNEMPESGKINRLKEAMYSREIADKLEARNRRELSPDAQLVGNDWVRPEPETPKVSVAPSGISTVRVLLKVFLAIAVLFFLGAASFFTFYFTIGGGSLAAPPENIDIAVSGPPQVSGGEPTELQIVVTNRNQSALQAADLLLTYPEGTRSPADLSTTVPTQRISLGDIEPGGQRRGTVSAVFSGQSGDRAEAKIELEYHIAGSNAVNVAHTVYDFQFNSSPITVSVDGNTETVSGQPIEFVVTVAANGSVPVKDVLLRIKKPFGFMFDSADVAPKDKDGTLWELGDLSPSQKKVITVDGVQTGATGDKRVFTFEAGTRKDKSASTMDTVVSQSAFTLNVSQPFLGLAVSVNGQPGSKAIVSPGSTVNASISYQNNLTYPITDAVIVARLAGVQVDGASMRLHDGFFRSADDSLIWNKTTTGGALGTIAPGDKGELQFSFQVPPSAALQNARSPYLDISVNAAGNRVGQSGVPVVLQGATTQHIALNSDIRLAANGLYYSNPFGSQGPMPPQAGVETTYAIVFTVTNTTNKIINGTVTATLPPYVRWTGVYSPSTEKITFDRYRGVIRWDLGDVAPNTGIATSTRPRQAAVSIGMTPSTSQLGQQPKLIEEIQLDAFDSATNQELTRTAPDVTTNILGDKGFLPSNANVVARQH